MAVWALMSALVTVGCSGNREYRPPDPPVVLVTMREYRFDYSGVPPRGRVVVRATDGGHRPHSLTLVPLPEDFPPIAVQLSGQERRFINSLAALPDRGPGEEGTFAVDLAPGRYAFLCTTIDPDGRSHALKGMATEFRIN